jgi:hypothetical protein
MYDWRAQAIGARSQSAKTYLEKRYQTFEDCSRDDLIKHGLLALRETIGSGVRRPPFFFFFPSLLSIPHRWPAFCNWACFCAATRGAKYLLRSLLTNCKASAMALPGSAVAAQPGTVVQDVTLHDKNVAGMLYSYSDLLDN